MGEHTAADVPAEARRQDGSGGSAAAAGGVPVRIAEARAADLGELWSVQRAAYVDDAQLYGDPFVLPLTETPDQVARAVAAGAVLLKAVEGARIVGGARGKAVGASGVVARLFTAPDRRRAGIGRALLSALEERLVGSSGGTLTLSTGHGGGAAPALFRSAGYRETRREALHDHLTLVHFAKDAGPPP
ncbi:GNAT family N-acetyltransferase [Nocardiopsis coralliicola]